MVNSVVTANGSGSITLNTSGLLTANNAISSGTGNLILTGGTGVTHTDAGDLTTTGVGTISVTATTNDITMANGTVYSAGSGQVDLLAATNVKLGQVTTTSSAVNVTATAGAITDNTSDENPNITTSETATLVAATGIGASGAGDIDMAIGTLVATNNTSGDIFVQDTSGLILGGGGVLTTGGNGNINIDVAGAMTVEGVVTANGSGNIVLNAAGSITANADVTSSSGNISLHAGTDVMLNSVITTTGNVNVTADTGSISDDGSGVDIIATSLGLNAPEGIGSSDNWIDVNAVNLDASTAGGNIYLNDIAGGVAVGLVTTGGTTSGEVNLTATNGSITESGSDSGADIVGETLNLTVTGTTSTIGTAVNTLEINAVNLNASTEGGNIYLNDMAGGIAVGLVTTGGATSGSVNLKATDGSIIESGSDPDADIVGETLNLAVTGPTSSIGTAVNTLKIDAVNLNASTEGGNIYLSDIGGGVAVGLVTTGGTTSGTVNLTAIDGSILEWGSDPDADIVGETLNLEVTGPTSTIGSVDNILEVDSGSNTLNMKTAGGSIYLNEILGNASIGLIDAGGKDGGEVYLIVTDGGITESGNDPEPDVVGKSVILVINTQGGSSVGGSKNMLEISSPELIVDNPEGNSYVDLNGTAASLLPNELPEGMIIDRAHLPALLVFNSRIIGGDQIDGLLNAEAEIDAYQFQMQHPVIFGDLLLPSPNLPAADDDELTLVNNIIK